MHCGWRNAKSRHFLRLEPYAHSEGSLTENIGALNAADGAQFGLNYARHVIRDLVLIEIRGREPKVHCGKLSISRLQVNDGCLRFGRQVIANLRDLGLYLSKSRVGVVVEL